MFDFIFPREMKYWEENLEYAPNYVIEKTGMSRDKLKTLIEYLHEEGILYEVKVNKVHNSIF